MCDSLKNRFHLPWVGHIGAGAGQPVGGTIKLRQCGFVYVTDMHSCACLQKTMGHDQPYSSGRGGYKDPLAQRFPFIFESSFFDNHGRGWAASSPVTRGYP